MNPMNTRLKQTGWLLLVVLLLQIPVAMAAERVYGYRPNWVTLEGKLMLVQGVSGEGARYSFPALLLDNPVTVGMRREDKTPVVTGISLVQLALNYPHLDEFKTLRDQRVRIVGVFTHVETARTRVVLTPISMTRVEQTTASDPRWR